MRKKYKIRKTQVVCMVRKKYKVRKILVVDEEIYSQKDLSGEEEIYNQKDPIRIRRNIKFG